MVDVYVELVVVGDLWVVWFEECEVFVCVGVEVCAFGVPCGLFVRELELIFEVLFVEVVACDDVEYVGLIEVEDFGCLFGVLVFRVGECVGDPVVEVLVLYV